MQPPHAFDGGGSQAIGLGHLSDAANQICPRENYYRVKDPVDSGHLTCQ